MNVSRGYRSHQQPNLPRVLKPATLAIALLLVAAYVVELNLVSRRGFQTRALEQQLTTLSEENRKLNLRLAELQSLTGLEERVAALGLVPAVQVEYLEIGAAAVARR